MSTKQREEEPIVHASSSDTLTHSDNTHMSFRNSLNKMSETQVTQKETLIRKSSTNDLTNYFQKKHGDMSNAKEKRKESQKEKGKRKEKTRQTPLIQHIIDIATHEVEEGMIKFATINVQGNIEQHWDTVIKIIKKRKISALAVIDHGRTAAQLKYLPLITGSDIVPYWAPIYNIEQTDGEETENDRLKKCGVGLIVTAHLDSCRLGTPTVNKSRALKVSFKTPNHRVLTISVIYCPAWSQGKAIEWLTENLPDTVEDNVAMGDFNLTIDERVDSYRNHTVLASHSSHNLTVQTLMQRRSYVDTYRAINGKGARDYTHTQILSEGKYTKRRIDHIWVNKKIADTIVQCEILQNHSVADHAMVETTMALFKLQKLEQLEAATFTKRKMPDREHATWIDFERNLKQLTQDKGKEIGELIGQRDPYGKIEETNTLLTEILQTATEKTWKIRKKKKPPPEPFSPLSFSLKVKRNKIRKLLGLMQGCHTALTHPTSKAPKVAKLDRKIKGLRGYNIMITEPDYTNIHDVEKAEKQIREELKKASHEYYRVHKVEKNQKISKCKQKLFLAREKDPNELYKAVCERKASSPIMRVLTTEEGQEKLTNGVEETKEAVRQDWKNEWRSKGRAPKETAEWLKDRPPRAAEAEMDTDYLTPPTMEELEEAIAHTKNGKSPGCDQIHNEVLKRITPELKELMLELFRQVWEKKETPSTWKHSRVFLIYKNGTQYKSLNYRPIALLSCIYKLFSRIVERRIRKVVEKYELLSNFQFGFRKGRNTADCITLLQQIIHHAKINSIKLILEFIDLKKAFDSTEHWSIEQAMKYHGIPTHLAEIVMCLLKCATSDIITGVGVTDNIDISCGVRQGDIISPLLFILFLNPLLRKAEGSGLGYVVNTIQVPGEALADDLVLISNNNEAAESLHKLLVDFCQYNNIELNPSKSAVMCSQGEAPTLKWREMTIPCLTKEETYKYLGIQINVCGDTSKAWTDIKYHYNNKVDTICRKFMTTQQRIILINKVAHAKIGYILQHISVSAQELKALDQHIIQKLNSTIRIRQNTDDAFWHVERGLIALEDLYKALRIATLTNRVLNNRQSINYVIHIELSNRGHPLPLFVETAKMAKEAGLEIVDMEKAQIPLDVILHKQPKIAQEKLPKDWKNNLCEMEDSQIQLRPLEELREIFSEVTESEWKYVKARLCEENSRKVKNLWLQPTLSPFKESKGIACEEQIAEAGHTWKKCWLVWTDGSVSEEDVATSAIWFGDHSTYNTTFHTFGEQTINNAELQGVEYVLIIAPRQQGVIVVLDSKYVKSLCEKPLTEEQLRHAPNALTIRRVYNLLREREQQGAETRFVKVYSHKCEKLKQKDAGLTQRIRKQERGLQEEFGEKVTQMLYEGNEKVDELTRVDLDMRKSTVFLEGGNRYQLIDTATWTQVTKPILKAAKKHLATERHRKWYLQRKGKRRLRYQWDPQYNSTLTTKIFKSLNMNENGRMNYMHKVLQGALTVRDVEENIATNMNEAHPHAGYMKKAYNDHHCSACKEKGVEVRETYNHLAKCPALKELRDEAWKEIKNYITSQGGNSTYLRPWFYCDSGKTIVPAWAKAQIPATIKLRDFNKQDGTLGFIPAYLEIALQESGINKKKCKVAAEYITNVIQRMAHTSWKLRCNLHSKAQQLLKQRVEAAKEKRKKTEAVIASPQPQNRIERYLQTINMENRAHAEEPRQERERERERVTEEQIGGEEISTSRSHEQQATQERAETEQAGGNTPARRVTGEKRAAVEQLGRTAGKRVREGQGLPPNHPSPPSSPQRRKRPAQGADINTRPLQHTKTTPSSRKRKPESDPNQRTLKHFLAAPPAGVPPLPATHVTTLPQPTDHPPP